MKIRKNKLLSILLTLAMLMASISCIASVTVAAASAADIRSAAELYVKNTGNDSTLAGLLSAVQKVESTAALETENYFIYHAVDGVYDEDPDEADRLSIPGHDGYVSAIFTVGTERISFITSIPHTEENLGVLTKISTSDENAADVFIINGKSLDGINPGTAGNYEKIIIDSNINATPTNFPLNFAAAAKVLILRNNGTNWASNSAFRCENGLGWTNLKAVYMDNSITDQGFFRPGRDFFGITTLKYFHFPENATRFYLNYNDFNGLSSLENVNLDVLGTMDTTNHTSFRNASSLYSMYLGKDTVYSAIVGGPKNQVIMTYEQQQTATFARAAVLAKSAVDSAVASGVNDKAELLAAAANAYSGKIENVTAEWAEESVINDYGISAALILTHGTDKFNLELKTPKALAALDIGAQLYPVFDPTVSEYTADIAGYRSDVTVNAVAADGASVTSVTGNTGLEVGVPQVITVSVKNTEGKTVTYKITATRKSALPTDARAAAEAYVQSAKNTVKADELLAAVNTVLGTATLESEDFFVKHAVDGVYDNDSESGYPLSIKGSDGSVSAVFTYNGKRYAFNSTFSHENELINIDNYAVIGDPQYDEYFEYDENGNVTAVNGKFDKLIFPEGYAGTMKQCLGDSLINADTVKVLIINNKASLLNNAFRDWQELRAVQFLDEPFLFSTNCNQIGFQFQNCYKLKYVKLPSEMKDLGWGTLLAGTAFFNCLSLENINMPNFPTARYMAGNAFAYTNIRDVFLTKNILGGINDTSFKTLPSQNGEFTLTYYTDNMTFARAAALIGAAAFDIKNPTESGIIAAAKAAVTGSHDSAEYVSGLDFKWVESGSDVYTLRGTLYISDGTDDVGINIECAKTLTDLTVDGYDITPAFQRDNLSYEISVPYGVQSVAVNAIAAENADMHIIGTDIADSGAVTIKVTTGNGETAEYSISVKWEMDYTSAVQLAGIRKALLGIKGNAKADINGDSNFDIRDLIRFKRYSAEVGEEYTAEAKNPFLQATPASGLSADDWKYVVSYIENGEIKDTLFDSVIAIPESSQHFTATKRNIGKYINGNMLMDGYNLDALDAAVGELKETLMKKDPAAVNYRVQVYLPLFYIPSTMADWGSIDGAAVDCSVNADRVSALIWSVDEALGAFADQKYKNLSVAGMYYVKEELSDDESDAAVYSEVTDYIRGNGLTTMWIPYYNANGWNTAQDTYGIDTIALQANYFPGAEYYPNNGDIERVAAAAERAKNNGCYTEMEICGMREENISGIKEYYRVAAQNGTVGEFHPWWVAPSMKELAGSENSYIRSAYTEMKKFIDGTLKVTDILTK